MGQRRFHYLPLDVPRGQHISFRLREVSHPLETKNVHVMQYFGVFCILVLISIFGDKLACSTSVHDHYNVTAPFFRTSFQNSIQIHQLQKEIHQGLSL